MKRSIVSICATLALALVLAGCGNPLTPAADKKSHLVIFDKNSDSASGTMASQNIAEGATETINANAFARDGYAFAGWAESRGATSAKYADKASYTMGSADITLYALWTQNYHTVNFDANGGAGTMASQSIAEGASATLSANAFTNAGHSFLGWATASGATSAEYADGASFSMGSADVKLYALWGLAAPTITTTGDFRKTVAINAAGTGGSAEIRYTMDGSTPTVSSTLYSNATPPVVAGHMVTRTVKAIVVEGTAVSAVASLDVTSAIPGSGAIAMPSGYTTISGIYGTKGASPNWTVDGDKDSARYFQIRAGVSDGNYLYLCDFYSIRKVTLATGNVVTLAGLAGTKGYVDGAGADARFDDSWGITYDGKYLYVADSVNNRIRRVDPDTGETSTFAGSGAGETVDGTGTAAAFAGMRGISTDGTYLYVTHLRIVGLYGIRKIEIATAKVTTLAGGTDGYQDGTAANARFAYGLTDIVCGGKLLYVADDGNNRIRTVDPFTGETATLAGSATGSDVDGIGTSASFKSLHKLAYDGTSLYMATYDRLRKLDLATKAVTSMAAAFDVNSWFLNGGALATDGTRLYAAGDSYCVLKFE